jgi:hypothetical protein
VAAVTVALPEAVEKEKAEVPAWLSAALRTPRLSAFLVGLTCLLASWAALYSSVLAISKHDF